MSQSLYLLLQDAAGRFDSRPAMEFGAERRTYGEMLEECDRLAALLTRHGAAPGARVAFCFKKSIDAIVALFAIIRTGATYVPLEPTWPDERKRTICEDAGIRLWLGTDPPANVPCVESSIVSNAVDRCIALSLARREPPASGPPVPPADDLANILYTSGSTGRPKGVQITTQSLLHFSHWAAEYFELTPEDRVANHAPYNFDLSTLDIFAAVCAGATMCPVPERLKMFPYQMAKWIADTRVSIWYSVPSALVMMQLRGKLADHDLSALRHVIFAGEVLPKPALKELSQQLPGASWTNLYGPTETNACTYHRVTQTDLDDDGPLPIGRALSDTRLWIVDESGTPIFGGDAGELLVAGPIVTSGYFGDAELTAHRLVPAPDGAGLAYRTGDRVRRRSDGILMFEGRIDRMIKCRGHRIEPGEVEAAIVRHPQVKEVAVVALPDPIFGNRLKACIAPREGARPSESELIEHCRDKLPAYMLPDVWQFYDSLPRTDREKVDLQGLTI
ncbi:MAG TPA: amino acid adenylation domain-containing protein [Phycisphaerae bacterium]|nr:amino acid adenylation domain-containing protein [Phycisphaerae bacterium]